MLCKSRLFGVGTTDSKAFIQKNLGKTAHADSTDAHKMHVNRFFKINLIHIYKTIPFYRIKLVFGIILYYT